MNINGRRASHRTTFLECSSWFYSQDNPVSFLGSGMDIRGDDLDLKARYRLIPGTTTFLQRSVELSEDLCSYQSFHVLKDRDHSAAALIFENEPPEIQTKLSSESIPFDDAYREHTYQEAFAILEETGVLQEGADAADEPSARYHHAAFFLAIGLTITAWAALYDSHPRLRLIFTLLALPCLAMGVLILTSSAVRVIGLSM